MPYILDKMVPLLRTRDSNPHATLITMLGKAVRDNITSEERLAKEGAAAQLIRQYLSLPVPTSMDDPSAIKIMHALDYAIIHDPAIKRYVICSVLRLGVHECPTLTFEQILEEAWDLPEGSSGWS